MISNDDLYTILSASGGTGIAAGVWKFLKSKKAKEVLGVVFDTTTGEQAKFDVNALLGEIDHLNNRTGNLEGRLDLAEDRLAEKEERLEALYAKVRELRIELWQVEDEKKELQLKYDAILSAYESVKVRDSVTQDEISSVHQKLLDAEDRYVKSQHRVSELEAEVAKLKAQVYSAGDVMREDPEDPTAGAE